MTSLEPVMNPLNIDGKVLRATAKVGKKNQAYVLLVSGQANTAWGYHWGIENQLHWCLDVVFYEDQQRIRLGNGAENFATARKMALQVLHRMDDKESLKSRRKLAGWDDNYLIKLLTLI